MEIYLYTNCTSCKKAEQALNDSGKPFERRDYFKDRFSSQELRDLLNRAGLSVQDALSRRSRAYVAMGLADRDLADEDLLALMVEQPTLLRRPIVIGNGGSVVGFNAGQIESLIARS